MNNSLSNKEKIKSKKLIEKIFQEGRSVSVFPLQVVYLQTAFADGSKVKTGVAVSKRLFKKAVDRNRIKRLLREAYRLNKDVFFNNITTQYAFMILYIGKDKPNLNQVDTKIKLVFKKFYKAVNED